MLPVISFMVESPTIRMSGSSAFCEMGPRWLEVAVADASAAPLCGDWFLFHINRLLTDWKPERFAEINRMCTCDITMLPQGLYIVAMP